MNRRTITTISELDVQGKATGRSSKIKSRLSPWQRKYEIRPCSATFRASFRLSAETKWSSGLFLWSTMSMDEASSVTISHFEAAEPANDGLGNSHIAGLDSIIAAMITEMQKEEIG